MIDLANLDFSWLAKYGGPLLHGLWTTIWLAGVGFGLAIGAAWIPGFAQVMPGLTFHFPGTTALGVAAAAIVLGTLAAIVPARRAARLKVIEALTYE